MEYLPRKATAGRQEEREKTALNREEPARAAWISCQE
jgi:hypothetical protein